MQVETAPSWTQIVDSPIFHSSALLRDSVRIILDIRRRIRIASFRMTHTLQIVSALLRMVGVYYVVRTVGLGISKDMRS